jgi:HSP20 family protein
MNSKIADTATFETLLQPLRGLAIWQRNVDIELSHESELEAMQKKIDRMVEDMHRRDSRESFAPVVDMGETDQVFMFTVELPGMDESDVTITVTPDTIAIRGHKITAAHEEMDSCLTRERRFGFVERILLMPEGVDTEDVGLKFKNGVLTIRVAKLAVGQQPARRHFDLAS